MLGTGTSGSVDRGFSCVVQFTATTTHAVKLKLVVTPNGSQTDSVDIDEASLPSGVAMMTALALDAPRNAP